MNQEEKIPDKISSAGRELPFRVPESYFDELPGRIQDSIDADNGQTRIRPMRQYMARAAVFIGLLTIGYAGIRILTDKPDQVLLSEEGMDNAIEYLAWNLDNAMLANVVIESDVDLVNGLSSAESEEIIQYLSEEEIDFSTLIEY